MTWTEAIAAAGRHGHEMEELRAPDHFMHMARCCRCGGLNLAVSDTDAFGEPTRQRCTPTPRAEHEPSAR